MAWNKYGQWVDEDELQGRLYQNPLASLGGSAFTGPLSTLTQQATGNSTGIPSIFGGSFRASPEHFAASQDIENQAATGNISAQEADFSKARNLIGTGFSTPLAAAGAYPYQIGQEVLRDVRDQGISGVGSGLARGAQAGFDNLRGIGAGIYDRINQEEVPQTSSLTPFASQALSLPGRTPQARVPVGEQPVSPVTDQDYIDQGTIPTGTPIGSNINQSNAFLADEYRASTPSMIGLGTGWDQTDASGIFGTPTVIGGTAPESAGTTAPSGGFLDYFLEDLPDVVSGASEFTDAEKAVATQGSGAMKAATLAEATARNIGGMLGLDFDPMSTKMSEEGLEKVLAAAYANQLSNPNEEIALTTPQGGKLGLSKDDLNAFDTNIGRIKSGSVTLSPAGYSFYDPAGIQLGSKAVGTDLNPKHAQAVFSVLGLDGKSQFAKDVVDNLGVLAGVHPVAGFAPSTGGGGTDALYYSGYQSPSAINKALDTAYNESIGMGQVASHPGQGGHIGGPTDPDITIPEMLARQDARTAASVMAPRQQAMPEAVAPAPTAPTVAAVAAQDRLAQMQADAVMGRAAEEAAARDAARQAQQASAAQAQSAQNAARAVLASAAGRDRGGPSQREIAAAIEVMSGVDSFGSGGMRNTRGEVGMDETGYTDTSGYGVG